MGGGMLDFANQPDVFKTYSNLPVSPLPQIIDRPEHKLSDLVRGTAAPRAVTSIDRDLLSRVLVLTHSLTAKARYGDVEFYYRSVASAGALYPFELYVGVSEVAGLDDGIYHHSVARHALTRLRSGDVIPSLSKAVKVKKDGRIPLAFFLTSIFFRSSWKYRDRAYRYNLLDTGHLAENLVWALRALGLTFRLYYDFDDKAVCDLLAVDPAREACLAIICVRQGSAPEQGEHGQMQEAPEALTEASKVALREKGFPLIEELHASTYKITEPPMELPGMPRNLGVSIQDQQKIPAIQRWPETMTYADAVWRRRSSRNFVQTELPADALVALLELLSASRRETSDGRSLTRGILTIGFLAGRVQDLDPGFYILDVEKRSISLVAEGLMMDKMAHVCLDQEWLANCALHFMFLTNLELLEKTWGPRGYRYAMLTAGRLGERIYLGATSMRIGCCGIGAYYDDEAGELLKLDNGSAMLYLVAAGPLKKWTEPRR
jgi:SagB-type dehydrogenase family enzyme